MKIKVTSTKCMVKCKPKNDPQPFSLTFCIYFLSTICELKNGFHPAKQKKLDKIRKFQRLTVIVMMMTIRMMLNCLDEWLTTEYTLSPDRNIARDSHQCIPKTHS